MTTSATWRLLTPATGVGAIAIIEIDSRGDALLLDSTLKACHLPLVRVGEIRLCSLLGVDEGLLVRWSPSCCHLMPHGGGAIQRRLADALSEAGIQAIHASDSIDPQAFDIEAVMLDALSIAASPLAIDLLLAQPALHALASSNSHTRPRSPRDHILRRLLHPPLVVVLGPSNVGKSSLLNVLAGRQIAIAADEPGTTRDHVGAMLDLAGLVVRWVDTPGIRLQAGELESRAVSLALQLAAGADLLVLCGDATAAPPELALPPIPTMRIATRADLGPVTFAADHSVSVHDPDSIGKLVRSLRERLVPRAMLEAQEPWTFWD